MSDSSVSRLQAEIFELPRVETEIHSAEQRLPVQSGSACMSNAAPRSLGHSSGQHMPGCRSLRHMRHTQSSFARTRPKSAPPRGRSQLSDAAFTMLQSTQYERGACHGPFFGVNDQHHDLGSPASDYPTMRTLRLTPEDEAALYARNMRWRSKVEKRLESLRQEKQQAEVSECTFRPCVQPRSSRSLLQVLSSRTTSRNFQLDKQQTLK